MSEFTIPPASDPNPRDNSTEKKEKVIKITQDDTTKAILQGKIKINLPKEEPEEDPEDTEENQ